MKQTLKFVGWVLQTLGSFVGRLTLTLLYFSAVVPFALISRVMTDPLTISRRARAAGPRWHPCAETQTGWDEARRQG